jgi:hypothetical protein
LHTHPHTSSSSSWLCTHTHKLLVIVASVYTTYWFGVCVCTFCCWLWDFVDILLEEERAKPSFCVCEVDSMGIIHIRTPLLVIIYI